jgi:sortase (surface protein transpeptidase)
MTDRKQRPLWRLILALIMVGIGVVIFVSSLLGVLQKPSTELQPAEVITYSTDTPEEKTPAEAGYSWRGLSNDPKFIAIPSLGVDALIQNVGIDQNSQIAVPNNIHIAGWFIESVRPGERGLSIIDGHVNGRNSDRGVFKNLPNLKVGETVTITFGDGSVKKFSVYSNQSLPTQEAASVLYSQIPSIVNQLNLITCTGSFDTLTQTYKNRQIAVLTAI